MMGAVLREAAVATTKSPRLTVRINHMLQAEADSRQLDELMGTHDAAFLLMDSRNVVELKVGKLLPW